MQTLSQSTSTYIPLAPPLLSIITSLASTKATKSSSGSGSKSHAAANSTLKPLLLSTHIRAPTAYLKTRVFIEGLTEEVLFLLLQWSAQLQASIAFPEIIVPVIVGLKRSLKIAKQTKGHEKTVHTLKTVIERLEEGRSWALEKRKDVGFAPNDRNAVDQWQRKMMRFVEKNESPVGKYASVLERKRNRERAILERAREGKSEILEEDA
jgi:nucleolar complex protein 2